MIRVSLVSGLEPIKRAAVIWRLLCSVKQCWNSLLLSKSNLKTQATRVCRLVYHESQFKTFLSPNTLLKVRTDSPACFLVLFSQTACSQFWMEGLMYLSWSFATFCYCCLLNGLKGHIMLWKYLTSEWRFLNTLPILFFLCSIFRGVCLMVARNDLDFNMWT